MKHLTQAQRNALAQRLDVMRRQTIEELRHAAPRTFAQPALNDGQDVRERAAEAEAQREDDVRQAEMEVDRRRLEAIEQAQLQLSEGRYGICTSCGREITAERLMAQPIAIRCAACQTQFELRRR